MQIFLDIFLSKIFKETANIQRYLTLFLKEFGRKNGKKMFTGLLERTPGAICSINFRMSVQKISYVYREIFVI